MAKNFRKKLKLKQGNITKTKMKHEHADKYHPQAEGNFCNEYENALNPARLEECNRHMRNVDKPESGERVTYFNICGIFSSEEFYSPYLIPHRNFKFSAKGA
jgi:hypothetical protein